MHSNNVWYRETSENGGMRRGLDSSGVKWCLVVVFCTVSARHPTRESFENALALQHNSDPSVNGATSHQ